MDQVYEAFLNSLTKTNKYAKDPVGYARDVLGIELWSKQQDIANAVVNHPLVMVESGHALGKSLCAAVLAIWFYETFENSIVIISAPTFAQVQDVVFKEIRRLYKGSGKLLPKNPRLESSAQHYIVGYTSDKGDSFQGRHFDNGLIIFDEMLGIDPEFWLAAKGMVVGGSNSKMLAIGNPTDPSSQAWLESQSGEWYILSVSAFEHPNIVNELQGKAPIIPSAVRLAQTETRIREWCSVSTKPTPNDFIFKGITYTPGPIADSRIFGRYPSQGAYGIYSESTFYNTRQIYSISPEDKIFIGCDCARFGDDYTSIHVRLGKNSLYHETYNGQDTKYTADRLKALALQFAQQHWQDHSEYVNAQNKSRFIEEKAKDIQIRVDEIGIGSGVIDQRGGYKFIGINVCRASNSDYANKRSEYLFNLANLMQSHDVSLAKLPEATFKEIKRQAVGITYKLDAKGRRVAEPKDKIKERIGRSPDDLEAVMLCYLDYGEWSNPIPIITDKPKNPWDRTESKEFNMLDYLKGSH